MDLRNKTLSASGFHSPERGTIGVLDDVLASRSMLIARSPPFIVTVIELPDHPGLATPTPSETRDPAG